MWTSNGLLLLLALGAAGTVVAVLRQGSESVSVPGLSAPGVSPPGVSIVYGIEPQLRPVPIRTGFILTSGRDAVALFEIRTPPGRNYYVKLVHVPTNATWVTLYVEGGKSFLGEVPLGEFELRWAMGQTWYGLHALFGPETLYERALEPLRFERTVDGITGHTVSLTLTLDGNLFTAPVAAKEF